MTTRSRTVRIVRADLFWEQVVRGRDDQCWLWMGPAMGGYGVHRERNRQHRAHRVAYELRRGAVPPGQKVLRRCNNRLCCNPAHLYLAASSPRSVRPPAPHRAHRRHRKLRPAEVAAIRTRLAGGERPVDVARAYDRTPACIAAIRDGRTWHDTRLPLRNPVRRDRA